MAIGLFLLAAQLIPDIGRLVPLAIGIVMLVGFALRRSYGVLVGGCIVCGVGVGVLLQGLASAPESGGIVLLSIGLGFVAIYAVSVLLDLSQSHWWPLVPGGIMSFIGAVVLSGRVVDDVLRWWPIALIAVGGFVIIRALLDRPRGGPSAPRSSAGPRP